MGCAAGMRTTGSDDKKCPHEGTTTTMLCSAAALLCSAAVLSCCVRLLGSAVVLSCRARLLCSAVVLGCCAQLLCLAAALSCCVRLLHSTAGLSCCVRLLRSTAALSCCVGTNLALYRESEVPNYRSWLFVSIMIKLHFTIYFVAFFLSHKLYVVHDISYHELQIILLSSVVWVRSVLPL